MLKNNVKLLSAFFAYLNQKPTECRTLVHEVLHDSKAEDFFRLHGLALLLMSLILSVDEQGVKPTIDWSKKSHDHLVSLWSHHLYEGIIRKAGHNEDSPVLRQAIEEQMASEKALSVEEQMPQIANLPAARLLQVTLIARLNRPTS